MNASKRWQSGGIASVRQRISALRRSKKDDLSETLFVDTAGTRSKLAALTDVGGPELEHRKNPFGTARTARFIAFIFLLFVLVVIAMIALIIEFGGPPSVVPR